MNLTSVVDFAAKSDNPYPGTGLVWYRVNHPTANQWRTVCYSPIRGRWVAMSDTGVGNRVTYSRDLITWTTGAIAVDRNWQRVRFGYNRYVAVSTSGVGNRCVYSLDGINWSDGATASDQTWEDLVYADTLGLWVAVASSGLIGQRVMTSADGGATWTARTAATADNWRGIAWSRSLGLLVAVADSGVGTRVMSSPDGINWTTRVNPVDNNWQDVVWCEHHGLFVAGANTGINNRVMTSPDGINWTIGISAITDRNMDFMATDDAGIRIVSVGATAVVFNSCHSQDGFGWTQGSLEQQNGVRFYDVQYGMGRFVAVNLDFPGFYIS